MQAHNGLAPTAHPNAETHLFGNVDVTQVEALETCRRASQNRLAGDGPCYRVTADLAVPAA